MFKLTIKITLFLSPGNHLQKPYVKKQRSYRIMIGAYRMKRLNNKNNLLTASLTVEAALVLPIFIFACYAFLFFFYIIGIQENLHNASTKVCETVASYGYLVRYIENRGEELKDKESQNADQKKEDNVDISKNNDEEE